MDKTGYIQEMFAGISGRYDLLNYLLSLGRDRQWRRFAVAQLPQGLILDVCSGTGDVAIEASNNNNNKVIASDFCREMLDLGDMKIRKNNIKNVSCVQSNAEILSFTDETFNGAIVAFGIRNVADIKKALSEMRRVVKKGGKVVVLEFSQPENRIFKSIYYIYFKNILPVIGALISKKRGAYSYLPSSVMAFPERSEFIELMKGSGLEKIEHHDITFGIVTVYAGVRL